MRLARFMRLLAVLFLVGALTGLPLVSTEVQARGAAVFMGWRGLRRLSWRRRLSRWLRRRQFPARERPPGGVEPGRHPEPGPDRPHPDQPYNHTNVNNVNVNRNVNVTGGGWGPYYGGGGGWGGVAAGAAAGLAVGTVIGALSANAQQMVINNQTYYYDGGNYYQPCYQGTDSSYCVVADPNE